MESSPPSTSALLARLEAHGIRLGLETTHALLAELGDPHRRLSTVLVAGTNGKGSTATLLAAMASAAGYRTGLYTSPHLERIEERIRVDGVAIGSRALGAALRRVVAACESATGHPPTYFEAVTALAFAHFAREGTELAVLEVGMGGRLDATNAAEPVLSLITEVGLEHRRFLGETIEAIAREKAGIVRSGRPAVAWIERAEGRRGVAAVARERGAELVFGPEVARIGAVTSRGRRGQRVELRTPRGRHRLRLGLGGRHQAANLALAVLGAECLAERGWTRLDGAAIARGAAAARWPARLEWVDLPDRRPVLLDVAHNPDGAEVLAGHLRRSRRPYDLLFGALEDKEVARVLPPLAARAGRIVLTAPGSGRALPPDRLAGLLPPGRATVVPRAEAALDAALDGGTHTLLVCGSVYLVGEMRALLRRRFGVPPPAVGPLFDL